MAESDSIFGAPEKPTRANPAKPIAERKSEHVKPGRIKRVKTVAAVAAICILGGLAIAFSFAIAYKMFAHRPASSGTETGVADLQRLIDTMPPDMHPGPAKNDVVQRTHANKWAEENLAGARVTIATVASEMVSQEHNGKYNVGMAFGIPVGRTRNYLVARVRISGVEWDVLIQTGHAQQGVDEQEALRLTALDGRRVLLSGTISQPVGKEFGFHNVLNFNFPGNFDGVRDNVLIFRLEGTTVVAR